MNTLSFSPSQLETRYLLSIVLFAVVLSAPLWLMLRQEIGRTAHAVGHWLRDERMSLRLLVGFLLLINLVAFLLRYFA